MCQSKCWKACNYNAIAISLATKMCLHGTDVPLALTVTYTSHFISFNLKFIATHKYHLSLCNPWLFSKISVSPDIMDGKRLYQDSNYK